MRILVVDDNKQNRDMMSFILSSDGHQVIEAEDGQQALDIVSKQIPDLIFMDVIMPVMDGFEATQAIREYLGEIHVPILFLTGLSDDETLSKCLSLGGDDFLYKPVTHQVLRAKIKSHGRIRALTKQLNQQKQELMQHKISMEHEYDIAKNVFEAAMGSSLKNCKNTRSFLAPATNFSGDILLTAQSPAGSLYVLLADFTGHGLPAAIGALPVSQIFFEETARGESVIEIARKLNKTLEKFLPDDMFAAAAILEMNKTGNRVTLWNGGLPDILVCDSKGKLKEKIRSQHMALGIAQDCDFNREVLIKYFEKGDRIYLYSDGLTELKNSEGQRYGNDRLLTHFNGYSSDTFNQIINDNRNFLGDEKQQDDVTFLEINCAPVLIAEPVIGDIVPEDKLPWSVHMDLQPNELRERAPIALLTDMICSAPGIARYKDNLHTILTELFSNALEHGVLELSSKLKCSDEGYLDYYQQRMDRLMQLSKGYVHLKADFVVTQGKGVLSLIVTDSGKGFDLDGRVMAKQDDAFGRGIALVSSLCDSVEYLSGGTSVEVCLNVY